MTHEEMYNNTQLVGSTPTDSVNTEVTNVQGALGKTRHSGIFSEGNPYAKQLVVATTNSDKDALYERAVEWEANYANTLEEREYNSIENQVARERRAGINRDILGAGSSGGSASATGSAIAPVESKSSFGNVAQNVDNIVKGVDSACNVISSIATLGTASINAFEQIKTMPSRVSLADSQAYVAEQTKDYVVDTAHSQSIGSRLALLNQLSQYFTPESSTEDISTVLSTLGYSGDVIPSYEKAIRDYFKNPTYQANYQDSIAKANNASAYNAVFTSDIQNQLYENTLAIQQAEQGLTQLRNSIETGIQQYLSEHGYAEQVGSNSVEGQRLAGLHLKRDVEVFVKNLDDIKAEVSKMDARIATIRSLATSEGRLISPSEQLEIDTLANLRSQLMTLGSNNLQMVYGFVNNANAIMYQNAEMLFRDNGQPIHDPTAPRFLRTMNVSFGQYVKGSDIDLVSDIMSAVPYVGGTLSNLTQSSTASAPSNNYSYSVTR